MKKKKPSYLEVSMAVYKDNKKDMTRKDLDDFIDGFIDYVESKKMSYWRRY